MTTNPDSGTRDQVPLLDTPVKVADWLDASHGYRANAAVLDLLCDTYGFEEGLALWEAGGAVCERRALAADIGLVHVSDALAALIGTRVCPGTNHLVHVDSVDGDFVATCPSCRRHRQTTAGPDDAHRAIEAHKAPRMPVHLPDCYDDDGRRRCVCGADEALAERAAGIGDAHLAATAGEPF